MSQNSLAEEYQSEVPQPIAPQQRPLHNPRVKVLPKSLPVSKFEKCLMTVCGVVIVVMMIWTINVTIGVSATQHQLQDLQTRVTQLKSDNTNHRQEANELLSRSRLDKIAKKSGLTLSNDKIRNVDK
ncbi:cell division protein FtsL [Secundilactobacillus malefermentans]|nr:cell division protein FtsL [Secundilactobacillus malefermentans]KRM58526.1 protein required for the initiation of cell division [Secundilactobacillus malefermentans DSM 5705 = KCTC 3548]QEA30886.1 cell division protein FtsL [Secundilactobacillus malefermentans]